MTYRSISVIQHGSPDVLQVTTHQLRDPVEGEVRIKVLASPVCRPDVTARQGDGLFSNTSPGHCRIYHLHNGLTEQKRSTGNDGTLSGYFSDCPVYLCGDNRWLH